MAARPSAAIGLGNPCNATNLLAHGLKRASRNNHAQIPTTEQLQREHMNALLSTQKGRDFFINAANGVVFKIHSNMLIGQSKPLEQVAYPDNDIGAEKKVHLPENVHPLLVDRMVCFVYTSAYSVDIDATNAKIATLQHHTSLPPNTNRNSFELAMNYTQFQIAMYGLGEQLEYTTLMSYAFSRLVQYFLHESKDQARVKQLIEIVFQPQGSPTRLCQDEVGALKGLGIAAVLVHEKLHWSGLQMDQFRDLLADELDQSMWKEYRACYKQVKELNQGLLADSETGVASLASAMSNVQLEPAIEDVLHGLFDEYAYWSLKALRIKTKRSNAVLREVLPNIANKIMGGIYHDYYERKGRFNRPAKWLSAGPNGVYGSLTHSQNTSHTPLPSSSRTRAHDSPQINSKTQPPKMRVETDGGMETEFPSRHMSAVPASAGIDQDSTKQGFDVASRKIATPGRKFGSASSIAKVDGVNDPGEPLTFDRGGMHDTGLMPSQHAPTVDDQAIAGSASATSPADIVDNPFLTNLGSSTTAQMKALEDAGVTKKTEPNNGTNKNTTLFENLQIHTMAAPAISTFGGVGGRTMDFTSPPPAAPQARSIDFEAVGAFRPVGAAGEVDVGTGKVLVNPEGNKENILPSNTNSPEE